MKTFFLIFFFFNHSAFSLTLDEVRTLAIGRSSTLSAQEFETRALRSESDLKGKWQNPQVMGQFGSLESGNMNGSTAEVSFTQPVPLSDKFSLRKELAELAVSQQKQQGLFFRNWVSHQAVLSAWRVKVFHEVFKHGEERTQRLRLVKTYMETRPRVSIRHRVELSLIASLLLQLAKDRDQREHKLQLALNDLEFWTGKQLKPEELSFVIPDPEKLTTPANPVADQDPELKKALLDVKMSSVDQEIASKERRPDLFLGGGYRVENVSPVNHFSYAIVGLNIPLWDTGSARVETARARHMRDEKILDETRRRVEIKHRNQIQEVAFHLNQIRRFPPSILKSTENSIAEAERGFKQGVLDVNTFLQAETESHEVIDQIYFSWMDYLENLSGLALMNGNDLNWEKM